MSANVILIHGAWQGAWVWDDIVPRLAVAGIEAMAVDLPGSAPDVQDRASVTFADQVAHLASIVDALDGPVYVVGHSGGGLAASQIAEEMPDRIGGLVYLTGMMLPNGMPFAELVANVCEEYPSAAGIWPYLDHLDGMSRVPPAAAVEIFYQDCDSAAAAAAAARLTPQSDAARDVSPRVTPERFGSIPRVYIEALKDRSLIPQVQRRMQALTPGAIVHSLDTGHAPMLADPGGLAKMLVTAIDQLRAQAE